MMVVEEWDGLFVDDAQIKRRRLPTLDLGWPGDNGVYTRGFNTSERLRGVVVRTFTCAGT
jgi:hypothetical protein